MLLENWGNRKSSGIDWTGNSLLAVFWTMNTTFFLINMVLSIPVIWAYPAASRIPGPHRPSHKGLT
jgi:hypothetical protein